MNKFFKAIRSFRIKSKPRRFDFCQFIVNAGFIMCDNFENKKSFRKEGIEIFVFTTKKVKGYDMVRIHRGEFAIVVLKFIPTSRIMTEIMLYTIYRELEEYHQSVLFHEFAHREIKTEK